MLWHTWKTSSKPLYCVPNAPKITYARAAIEFSTFTTLWGFMNINNGGAWHWMRKSQPRHPLSSLERDVHCWLQMTKGSASTIMRECLHLKTSQWKTVFELESKRSKLRVRSHIVSFPEICLHLQSNTFIIGYRCDRLRQTSTTRRVSFKSNECFSSRLIFVIPVIFLQLYLTLAPYSVTIRLYSMSKSHEPFKSLQKVINLSTK